MKLRFMAVVGAATAVLAMPAAAQTVPGATGMPREGTMRPGGDRDITRETANNRALEDDRAVRRPRGGRARPAEVQQAARAAVQQAGIQCDVTAASNPGETPDGPIYEVSCADAPGWLVIASPSQSFNCLVLASGADAGSSRCELPGNADPVAAMKGYVRTLTLDCAQISQAAWVGRIGAELDRYEVRCTAGQGYWLEVDMTGHPRSAMTCAELATAGRRCRFDPPAA
ncbi:MAG: hypothetical protein EON88_31495 [Brevundimonas sp.]|nr:MAG: hypothetical protein EON88_31495 [Brevundimonas sp.]